MYKFKSEETREKHRRAASKAGKVKSCKGFAYMKKNDPERLKKISSMGGKANRKMNVIEVFEKRQRELDEAQERIHNSIKRQK